jgi:hypothetical protein
MKPLHKILIGLLSITFLLPAYNGFAQASQKGDLSIAINYFSDNNHIPYLVVKVKTKVNGRFQTVGGIGLKLFLDKDSAGTLIANMTTNEKGEATALIPPSLKKEWGAYGKHTFLATFDGDGKYAPTKADLTMSPARILISTSEDKKITASLMELKDKVWIPVKDVDVKIAVRRLGGDLPVNESPTFTTDSTGTASADFKRDSIPGDSKGNIILVAKVEDNDQYGNLSVEKTVPWGAKFEYASTFNRRTFFATGNKAPIWLLVVAISIIIAVWGILIYLVFNVFKIKKIGESDEMDLVV